MGNEIIQGLSDPSGRLIVSSPNPRIVKQYQVEKVHSMKSIDDDDESNCNIDGDEGPFSKYNCDFLKTDLTVTSKLMKGKNESNYLIQQFEKWEKGIQKENNYNEIKKDKKLPKNKKKSHLISSKKASEKKVKEVKILGENFIYILEQPIEIYYHIQEKIGEGAFGNVFRSYCKQSKELKAVKIFKKKMMEKKDEESLLKQINILRKLDHVNIIKLYDVFFNNSNYYIVTQFCRGGNLMSVIKNKKLESQYQISIIMKQLLCALRYLHEQKIVHRDLKLENIVLLNDCQQKKKIIKLIDFGFATVCENFIKNKGRIEGTVNYMSPETFDGQYSCQSDLWSTGIILCILLTGKNPFKKGSIEATKNCIQTKQIDCKGSQWNEVSNEAKQLVKSLLQKRPQRRISAKKALESPFIRQFILKDSGSSSKKLNYGNILENFKNFYRGSNFQTLIRSFICSKKVHQTERQQLAELFEKLDVDGSGFIEKKQLIQLYKSVIGVADEQQVKKMMEKVDANMSGRIDFTEFLMLMKSKEIMAKQGILNSVFQSLDRDRTGFIEKNQLLSLLEGFSNKEIQQIMKDLDQNNDKKISKEEFFKYLMN